MLRLIVDEAGVLLEDVVALGTRGVLQLEHRLGVEQVVFALAAPLVLATELEPAVGPLLGAARVGDRVTHPDRRRDLIEPDPAEPADGTREVSVDELLAEPDRFEDLGAGVRRHGRHPHLRHHLQHALAARLDVVLDRLLRVDVGHVVEPTVDDVLDRLERQVRVDRSGAVADQQRHVVHLAGVATLDDEADLGALLGAHQVVVHRRRQQQRRDRGIDRVGVAVAEHEHARTTFDRRRHLLEDRVERVTQRVATARHAVQPLDDVGGEAGELTVVVGVDDLRQLIVVEDRERQAELAAALGPGVEHVRLRPDRRGHRRDDLFADGVERRVGHLREQLSEVVEQQARALRQHGDRRVGTHRPDRLLAVAGHRHDDDLEFLVGVAEHLLAAQHAVVAEDRVFSVGQVVEPNHAIGQPFGVRVLGGELLLDLLVVDDATLASVDQEHLAGLQTALADDLGRIDLQHADFRSHDHEIVVGHPVAAGAQTVSVEYGTDHVTVGERDAGGPVPRLHHAGVELVERTPVGVHLVVVLPRLGDHHQHGVVERAAAEVQQLEHLVEPSRVGSARGADRERPVESGKCSLAAIASRARIQFWLPCTVLISPLWAT